MAYDVNFIVKGEGLLKVTGGHVHVHCKSGYIRLLKGRCHDKQF